MQATLRRTIYPQVRVIDAAKGINEYVASDETIDSYREIIRADGWRFDRFQKNAPFVDSHDYESIEKCIGKVIDFGVRGRRLVETVQWAIGVGHPLADLGWKLASNGFLPAVSVGFFPEEKISRFDKNDFKLAGVWAQQIADLGIEDESKVNLIYLRQQQIELSAVIIGANPNALAKSYKAGVIDDSDLEFIAASRGDSACEDAGVQLAAWATARNAEAFLETIQGIANSL